MCVGNYLMELVQTSIMGETILLCNNVGQQADNYLHSIMKLLLGQTTSKNLVNLPEFSNILIAV